MLPGRYARFLFLLFAFVGLTPHAARAQAPIGLGWARNNVNGATFRKNSVVTHRRDQYTAYYDSAGYVVLAKRRLPAGAWQVRRTPYQGHVQDAHNAISLIVDGAGYLHLAFDHHGSPLRYARSLRPGSLELTDLLPMTGQQEKKVTYPEFHRFPNGDLLFLYRDGSSGNGNLVLNRYRLKARQWTRLHNVLIDGEGQRNAYWQACIDARGTVHLAWVWRESPDVASNHDMAYARSLDGGRTWQKSTGQPYQIPITEKTAEYAWRIPQGSELINQTSIAADAAGNPYIATYWRPVGSLVPQYHLIYLANRQWKTVQVSQRTTPFSLSGAGTKKIPIARPQVLLSEAKSRPTVYVLFRDAERQDRPSLAQCADLNANNWTTTDLSPSSLGSWEPSYDSERWKREGVLDLFVQRTGQGDGETLEALPPQPVSVLEWRPPSGASSKAPAATKAPAASTRWQLVWADEFETDGPPNPRNWQFETGFVRNHELQWYQPDNARCENGRLILEARQEARPNPSHQPGSPDWRTSRPTIDYTSASLHTRGLHQWKFGRFEMRGRIDTSPGLWPVFWTLGAAKPWPSSGEIDILEYYQGKVLANVASGTNQPDTPNWHSQSMAIASFGDPDWSRKFHVWRMDWDAQAVRLYVDDMLMNETPLAETVNQDGSGFNPLRQPHYLLLSLAVGGDNGGSPSGTTFPARFEVDYVRVYQPR